MTDKTRKTAATKARAPAPRPKAKPVARKPAARKPAAEKSAAKKPPAEESVVKKPAAAEPASKKPAAEKPASKKPPAEVPVAKKPAAAKPAAAGYSGTPLAKKLGIEAGTEVFPVGLGVAYESVVAPLPAGARVVSRMTPGTDIVHIFATEKARLARALQAARPRLKSGGAIWASWPKGASKVATDISEDTVRALALPLGLVDVKVCAVDETWSGLKLVIRKALRPAA